MQFVRILKKSLCVSSFGKEWKKVKGQLVRWEVVERLVSLGGLEIENLRVCNKVLLTKWVWHFPLEPDTFWA